jgi:topoisomerase-4 subunit B
MPPLFRIDVGKDVFYALDEREKRGILDRIEAEKLRGKVNVQRFKGLGEMNPMQLRETTMAPDTRRLVQLVLDPAPDPAVAPTGTDPTDPAGTAAGGSTGTGNHPLSPPSPPSPTPRPPPPTTDRADTVLDMLLAKGRAADRRDWLMSQGDRASLES